MTIDGPAQEHEVIFGDDRIQVVLNGAHIASRGGMPGTDRSGLATAPYLTWTPLPYDTPDEGIALACLGAGQNGCLFIDLAAAPGTVAVGGESQAAVRLAESIAHQLCAALADDRSCRVVVVGDALPPPQPSGATWVPSLRELGPTVPPGPGDGVDIVFCQLHSHDDKLTLGRYVSSAGRRVVPVVLASLPDAPWSFTARPSRQPNEPRVPWSRDLQHDVAS